MRIILIVNFIFQSFQSGTLQPDPMAFFFFADLAWPLFSLFLPRSAVITEADFRVPWLSSLASDSKSPRFTRIVTTPESPRASFTEADSILRSEMTREPCVGSQTGVEGWRVAFSSSLFATSCCLLCSSAGSPSRSSSSSPPLPAKFASLHFTSDVSRACTSSPCIRDFLAGTLSPDPCVLSRLDESLGDLWTCQSSGGGDRFAFHDVHSTLSRHCSDLDCPLLDFSRLQTGLTNLLWAIGEQSTVTVSMETLEMGNPTWNLRWTCSIACTRLSSLQDLRWPDCSASRSFVDFSKRLLMRTRCSKSRRLFSVRIRSSTSSTETLLDESSFSTKYVEEILVVDSFNEWLVLSVWGSLWTSRKSSSMSSALGHTTETWILLGCSGSIPVEDCLLVKSGSRSLCLDFFLRTGATGLSSSVDWNFFRRRGLFWIFLTNLSHPSVILSFELLTNLLRKESLLCSFERVCASSSTSLEQRASRRSFSSLDFLFTLKVSGCSSDFLDFSLKVNLNLGLSKLRDDCTRSLKLCLILPTFRRALNRESSSLIEEESTSTTLEVRAPRDLDPLSSNVWRLERVVSSVEPLSGHLLSSRVSLGRETHRKLGISSANREIWPRFRERRRFGESLLI